MALGAFATLDPIDAVSDQPEVATNGIIEGVADKLQEQLYGVFTDIAPYAAGMLGLAYGWRALKRNLGARSAQV